MLPSNALQIKNTRAMYQRLVNKLLKPLIGKTIEVYVDDMITKSIKPANQVAHLHETFRVLQENQMKLNPEKCAFRVELRKFLGFLFS